MASNRLMTYPSFTTIKTISQKRGEEKVHEHQPIRRKVDTHNCTNRIETEV
jgi:hypothetical protein